MNDTILVANRTQTLLQKQVGIRLKLAYRNSEVGEIPFKEVQPVATVSTTRLTSPLVISITSIDGVYLSSKMV